LSQVWLWHEACANTRQSECLSRRWPGPFVPPEVLLSRQKHSAPESQPGGASSGVTVGAPIRT
jgi:hypothetical protein